MVTIEYKNGWSVTIHENHFPDGTLHIKVLPGDVKSITWLYESDSELFTLMCIKNHILNDDVYLNLPYIPHARMDRVKESSDVFTLKYFCEVINSLNFTKIVVRDPHSNVAPALLNRVEQQDIYPYVNLAAHLIGDDENLVFFYPDEGAMKRYSEMFQRPYSYGLKKRDWSTGKIMDLVVAEPDKVKDKNILIIDDICSYGGTFYRAAKALKQAGAKNINLYVTHCEQSVFKGEMYASNFVEKIYTTKSIMLKSEGKVVVFND